MKEHPHAALLERARHIASHFRISEPLEVSDFRGKGNINQHTYVVTAPASGGLREFLLQQLNPGVFTQPREVMNGMLSCIRAQQKALSKRAFRDLEWETIQLVPARNGKEYLEVIGESGTECWRMMARNGDALTFRSLQEIQNPATRYQIAEQAGRGLAIFGVLTADMDPSGMANPLPGYRDTELYYNQLTSVVAGTRKLSDAEPFLPSDPVVRGSTGQHYIIRIDPAEYRRRLEDPQLQRFLELAIEHRGFGLALAEKLKSGELRRVVIHGDTKLDNFLFSARTGKVKALVDLDTIMAHTWLSDWGDMVRSLVNIAGEREQDATRIDVDLEVFEALARGYLECAGVTNPRELELMVDAPQIMALELGVRFLADYLRGDTYFQLNEGDPQDLNKTRAMVQFYLFERLRSKADSSRQIINSIH